MCVHESVRLKFHCCLQVLITASQDNLDPSKLNEYAKLRALPADYSKVLTTVWLKESDKVSKIVICTTTVIHSYNSSITLTQINKKIQKDTVWNNTLDHLSWRVDVKATSKNVAEIDEPVAFFEFAAKRPADSNSPSSVAKFEMNREQVTDILRNLNDVHKKFDEVR